LASGCENEESVWYYIIVYLLLSKDFFQITLLIPNVISSAHEEHIFLSNIYDCMAHRSLHSYMSLGCLNFPPTFVSGDASILKYSYVKINWNT